ncbi:hypothetical protein LCGC14_2056530, partial [marine sediment metagenome]
VPVGIKGHGKHMTLELPRGRDRAEKLEDFAATLRAISQQIGFRISSRGWGYQLEGIGLVTKADFDLVEGLINRCRAKGLLPIDFTAEEEGRQFSGIEKPEEASPVEFLREYLEASLSCENWYTPDWWDGEECYIQMIVEKIDLKTLFRSVCEEYHIPVATTKGWSSMLQRAEYARRFAEAEARGLRCVLLYCGDHDPDGLRISEFLRKNLKDLTDIVWEDGTPGYDPFHLRIDRFGLNYDFITGQGLTWITNLITGSKRNLGDPSHPNHWLPYVQDYLSQYGSRKCEANALVIRPTEAEELCRGTIEGYLGRDAKDRFQEKRDRVVEALADFRNRTGLQGTIEESLQVIKREVENNGGDG